MTDDSGLPPSPARSRHWLTDPRLGVVSLGVSAAALALSAGLWLGGMDGRVRAYLLNHPEILDQMVQARQANEDRQRVEAINTAAAANPSLLAVDARDPAFGPADAKVTVIEFFDFRCPGCKAVTPQFLQMMRSHPEVRFVFKDWPILDRPGSEPMSQLAARAALAAHQQGKYLAVYEALMREPAVDEAAIQRILAANGVDLAQAQATINAPTTSRHLTDIHTTASALRLTGTPTFFVNGKTSASIDPAEINRMIEAAKTAPPPASR
ncbi:MAG TPA: thioredoxin domain-containing protein [Brevundimonas sp.]|uniref:DsbA family protein n=1 Tax=Brevundimonas sp. TaxID=1871086 RepID=UPI00261A0555|nr:thioredoxin domain-containing protein [Brevundimonas sp.]HRO33318.1 thioredoxin domain-containing protein [Brevundimonas sp.]